MPRIGIEPIVVTLQVCCITNYASVAYGGGEESRTLVQNIITSTVLQVFLYFSIQD